MSVDWLQLPRFLLQRCLLHLRLDERLRCAEVCPAWRDALADPSLWRRLELPRVFVGREERTMLLLDAAAQRARGSLECLDVSSIYVYEDDPRFPPVLDVLTEHADTLREVITFDASRGRTCFFELEELCSIMDAVPRLTRVQVGLSDCFIDSAPAEHAVGVWPALQMRAFSLYGAHEEGTARALRYLNEPTRQRGIAMLKFDGTRFAQPPGAFASLLRACSVRPIRELWLKSCTLPAGFEDLLVAFVRGDACQLRVLVLTDHSRREREGLRAANPLKLGVALAQSRSLTDLWCGLGADADDAAREWVAAFAFAFGADTPRLRRLTLEVPPNLFAISMSMLVSLNAPALRAVKLTTCRHFHDDVVEPRCIAAAALRDNTFLRCFSLEVALPSDERIRADGCRALRHAVRGIDSLQMVGFPHCGCNDCEEATRILHARRAARRAALGGCWTEEEKEDKHWFHRGTEEFPDFE